MNTQKEHIICLLAKNMKQTLGQIDTLLTSFRNDPSLSSKFNLDDFCYDILNEISYEQFKYIKLLWWKNERFKLNKVLLEIGFKPL